MITYCPNCTSKLTENKKLAQGVSECTQCKGRFLILETTKPKITNEQTKTT